MAQRAQTPEQTNKQPKIQTALFTCTANVLGFPRHSRCEVFSTYCEAAVQCKLCHSSLLRTFGLSATSTYDSYLPLIFGRFALI